MQTPRAPSSTPRNGLPASKPPTPPSSKKGRLTTRRISPAPAASSNPGTPCLPWPRAAGPPPVAPPPPPPTPPPPKNPHAPPPPISPPPPPPRPPPPVYTGSPGPPLPHPRLACKRPAPLKTGLPTHRISPAPAASSNPGTPCLPCQREVAGLPAGGIPPLSLRPQQKGPVPRSRGRQALFILAVRFPECRVPPLSRTGRSGRCRR